MTVYNAYEETLINGETFQRLSDDIREGATIFMREKVVELFMQFGNEQLKPENIQHYDLQTIYSDMPAFGDGIDLGGRPVWNFGVPEIVYLDDRPKSVPPELPVEPDESWMRKHTIWMDSLHGVAITYKNYPQAAMSFRPNHFDGDILRITQLQGVQYNNVRTYDKDGRLVVEEFVSYVKDDKKHVQEPLPAFRSPKGLGTLNWTCLLVGSAEYLAKKYGFTGVEIQRAENNANVQARRLSLDRARAVYNDTADQAGYKAEDDNSDFLKEL